MSVNSTSQLIGLVTKKFKFRGLFLSLFFNKVKTFDTEDIKLDEVEEGTNMAVFVSPVIEGKVHKTKGGITKSFTAPYVKSKHVVDPNKTIARRPGEALTGSLNPTQRLAEIRASNLKNEEFSIVQLEEWQAVQAAIHGKYTCEGEQHPAIELDFERNADNSKTLGVGSKWTDADKATHNPMHDIEDAAVNMSNGCNIIVMDKKSWREFILFDKVENELKSDRKSLGGHLDTTLKDLSDIVSYKGHMGEVVIVVYTGQYKEGGVKKNYLPDYCVSLGHTGASGVRTYGAIQDMKAIKEGITRGTRYPKNWTTDGDPSAEYTMIQSAPAMLTPDPDEFAVLWVG